MTSSAVRTELSVMDVVSAVATETGCANGLHSIERTPVTVGALDTNVGAG